MRVLITTDPIGGVWTFSQELARGLLSRGCAIALVSLGGDLSASQQGECEKLSSLWPNRFEYHVLNTPLEWMESNEHALFDAVRLLLIAREFGADVLHSNQFCFGILNSAIPTIVSAHSDVLSWARSCGRHPLPDSPWLRRYVALVQQGLLQADSVVAPTAWMLNALCESFALPRKQMVIANGRTMNCTATNDKVQQAVLIGRLWDEAKGFSLLNHISSPIPLMIAGDMKADAIHPESWNQQMHPLGVLASQEVCDLLCRSAIYLCTSVYEPFGLAPLEAGLCGCAVVARDIPSLREVWQDGALFFADAVTLSSQLQRLSSEPSFLADAQQRSRFRAQHFTRDSMTDKYLSLYTYTLSASKEADNAAQFAYSLSSS